MIHDVAFEDASDVTSICYRLAPLDVGFDLRETGIPVQVNPKDDPLRVSYATRAGERRVMAGPRGEVLKRLRQHGYRFRKTPPSF